MTAEEFAFHKEGARQAERTRLRLIFGHPAAWRNEETAKFFAYETRMPAADIVAKLNRMPAAAGVRQ
jgi:hypothetical protein